MKWWFLSVAYLGMLACRDPNSYQPFDPTKPDPPAPPVLTYPANGWMSDDYAYPQNVSFAWQAVPGSQFYEMQVNDDSLYPGTRPFWRVYQTSVTYPMGGFGLYYWRVRAVSSDWNNYTGWSLPSHFTLPNPGR
jgi:hypothetical protein